MTSLSDHATGAVGSLKLVIPARRQTVRQLSLVIATIFLRQRIFATLFAVNLVRRSWCRRHR